MRVAIVVLALVACGRSERRPPPDAAPDPLAVVRAALPDRGPRIEEPPEAHYARYIPRVWGATCPDTGAFTLARTCKPLPHAVVRTFLGTTWVAIGADRPPDCTQLQPWVDRSQDILGIELPSGPGGRYFDGKPFGAPIQLELADGTFAVVQMNEVVVALAPPVSMVAGAHVRGAIAIDGYGEGPFDAVVCPDQPPVTDAQPDAPPPASPLAGTVFGAPFTATVAHAMVSTHAHGAYVLLGLIDPSRGDPGCGDIDRWFVDGLSLSGGGVAAPYPLLRTPQPASFTHATRERGSVSAWGWIVWDEVPTTPGAVVRARAVVHSPPGARAEARIDLEGVITATVCPPRPR